MEPSQRVLYLLHERGGRDGAFSSMEVHDRGRQLNDSSGDIKSAQPREGSVELRDEGSGLAGCKQRDRYRGQ